MSADGPPAPPDRQRGRPASRSSHAVGAPERLWRTAEDRRLLRRYHATRDPAQRDVLVERFLLLARHLAGRYAGPEPFEDLYQVACLALVLAIERFDPERDAAFTTYAVPTIVGEVKRHFRDRTWTVRVPRDLQQLAVSVQRASDRMAAELGRPPTPAELARATAVSEERVRDALQAIGARAPISLDAHPDGHGASLETLGACGGVDEHGYQHAERRVYLEALAADLSDRQRAILRLRFVNDLTHREIGERVGLSEVSVWRSIRGALEHMRAAAAVPS